MGEIRKAINALLGRVHLHDDIVVSKNKILLHISDTPSSMYPELKRIIKVLKPDYIVHTGDIADEVKLGIYPSSIRRYMHEAAKLLKILNAADAKRVIISLGNHDDMEFIKKHGGKIQLIPDKDLVQIEGHVFAISHYSDLLEGLDAEIYLFGHDLSIQSQVIEGKRYLNGITSINIINLETMSVKEVKYPLGTDTQRLSSRRTKL